MTTASQGCDLWHVSPPARHILFFYFFCWWFIHHVRTPLPRKSIAERALHHVVLCFSGLDLFRIFAFNLLHCMTSRRSTWHSPCFIVIIDNGHLGLTAYVANGHSAADARQSGTLPSFTPCFHSLKMFNPPSKVRWRKNLRFSQMSNRRCQKSNRMRVYPESKVWYSLHTRTESKDCFLNSKKSQHS